MDDLRGVVDQLLAEGQRAAAAPSRDETAVRKRYIGSLFAYYQHVDAKLADNYLRATAEIPLDKLKAAIRALVRTHHWPRLPLVADIWRAARMVAGMDREQYHAGKYLPAPREWPPEGKRHAILLGELELIGKPAPQLTAGLEPKVLEAGEDRDYSAAEVEARMGECK